MSEKLQVVTERIRERLRKEGRDLLAEPEAVDEYLDRELIELSSRESLKDQEVVKEEILAKLTGFGPLQRLFDDEEVEEFWINSPGEVFLARGGRSELTDIKLSDAQVRDLVERMLRGTGRRVDLLNPFVDASLPDGSRLHVVIPDITAKHYAVNIRKFNRGIRSLDELVSRDSLTPVAANFLRAAIRSRANVLVSGSTQAGKTTMLNSLLSCCAPSERVVTVEETFELDVPQPDVVGMQCRQPNIEGGGEISLRRLIKEALRMRPDRLVVGEVREAESLDLLIALNSGLPGAGTLHANSARDALVKISTLPLLAGRNIDSGFIVPTVASCLDLIVHCELGADGRRQVAEILALSGRSHEGVIEAGSIFVRRDNQLVFTGNYPEKLAKFRRQKVDLTGILEPGRRGQV